MDTAPAASPAAASRWLPDHLGEDYLIVLARLNDILSPANYFEIGSRTGDSLALARCASIAIDPAFNLTPACYNNKPECHLYPMTSDDYFAAHSPSHVFGRPIEFAFLDGMHLAEFLLRDFINTEAHCAPHSVIALHDCLPVDAIMTRRDEDDRSGSALTDHPAWWTGDVWLVVEALKKYRPELVIHAIDAAPTGLILITGLNPGSTILRDQYQHITAAFHTGSDVKDRYLAYVSSLGIKPASSLSRFEDLAANV